MTKEEPIWGNIRFAILLFFCSAVVLTIVGKYLFVIPWQESADLIGSINSSEEVLQEQERTAKESQALWNRVDSLDFTIQQVHKENDIREGITALKEVYRLHNRAAKYEFGSIASDMLQFYFDINQALDLGKKELAKREQNLSECQGDLSN